MTFQQSVIKDMKLKGFLVLKIIRMNENGYPDLQCIKNGEQDHWIECKEEKDTLKDLQKYRIDELNKLGKRAYCLQKGKGQIYP